MLLNTIKNGTIWYVGLLVTALALPSTAVSDDFQILSGTFFMATVSDTISILEPGNNPGILIEGTFQGETPTGPYPNNPVDRNVDSNQVLFAPFPFFGQPVGTYTAETGVDGVLHAPPTIDLLNGVADMGAFYAYWNGTEFNQGNENATVIDNFDGTFKIFWSSLIVGGPFNGKTGDWVMVVECLTCPPSTAGASVGLSVSQGGINTGTVTQDAGNFTVSTDLTDTTGYTFNWGQTDDVIDSGVVLTTPTITIDPSMIPEGTYQIKVNVSNNNTIPVEKSASTFLVTVVTTGDLNEIGDVDNDGVPNSADTIADPNMLQTQDGNNTDFIMTSNAGRLTLGNVAICASSTSTSVTATDIKNNAGSGCIAVSNAADVLGEVKTGIGGYFDFAARSLAQGSQVQVVLPLSEPVSTNAGYRFYSFVDGWKPFATSVANEDIDMDNNFDDINEVTGEDVDGDGNLDVDEDINGDGNLDLVEDVDGDGNLDVDEDTNANGILDAGEDIDGDGNLDVDEDINGNGILDLDEDIDGDGNLDVDEDTNANGVLDAGEDIDGDGNLDVNEDLNANGLLDVYEDIDGDGNLDIDEDINGNGALDLGQDFDGDGHLDTGEDLNANFILDSGEDVDGDGVLDLTEDLNLNRIFDADAVYSAEGTAGTCPAANDSVWKAGLTRGHNCLRVAITDGGANDTDGQPNGIVTSTGTTIAYAGINSNLQEGCSVASNPRGLHKHVEWLILAVFISWLSIRRLHRFEA